MAEPTVTPSAAREPGTWKRRGLFAAVAALVAGLVARVSEQRVEAGTDGDVVLGGFNTTASSNTSVTSTFAGPPGGTGLAGICKDYLGYGVIGQGGMVGILGQTAVETLDYSTGVQGLDGTTTGSGIGVGGYSAFGLGVHGFIYTTPGTTKTIAVYGVNTSSYTGSVPGAGGFGVVGISRYGHGVLGATSALGAGAVVGATNGITGAYAGIFFGPAIVEGDFTVVGGAKSAAVRHPDGTHRRLYCVESPESWFEDFGEATLECGVATVGIDPDFAAVTDLGGYHVFLTAYGDFELHVSDRASTGFRVEARDATASGRFSWRVVAKRKDMARPRFEQVVVPPKPEMPTIPDPPAMPTPPVMRRHH